MVVTSANGDLYTPFPQGIMLEEGPQSSEEGSGLHSPIFGAPFLPHGDIRYHPDRLDINAVGVLASQFDYNNNLKLGHHSSLLETSIDVPSHHQNAHYHSEFRPPHRNHLASDYPAEPPSNTRIPPPPSQVGPADFPFNLSPERRLHNTLSYDQPLDSFTGASSAGMPMDSNQRSSPSSTGRRETSAATTAPGSREPRKEISMVVIACRQCRARKIRCDSTRPVCNNCVRRSNPCEYDAVPKRRGPDKRPGTRQRSCKKRPADGSAPPPPSKRKRTNPTTSRSDHDDSVKLGIKENMSGSQRNPSSSSSRPGLNIDTQGVQQAQQVSQPPSASPVVEYPTSNRTISNEGMMVKNAPSVAARRDPSAMYDSDSFLKSFARQLDVNVHRSAQSNLPEKSYSIPSAPSAEYGRQTWWDSLIEMYSATQEQSVKDIANDLSFLFNTTSYWLSFINVTSFLRNLYNAEERSRMQPSLIYAGLAMATLIKSSNLELGNTGRSRALWLRDAAQAELEKSWSAQLIDQSLAAAALVLALFESSAHPQYDPARFSSSLIFLDNIIRALNLTFLDLNEPNVSVFPQRGVPVVTERPTSEISSRDSGRSHLHPKKCSCIPLPPNASLPPDHFSSSWSYTPPWDPSWSPEELRNEEARRLCWSALNLVASHTSHCAVFQRDTPDLFLTDPANYALLFPGEVLERGRDSHPSPQAQSPKESVWALYCRSMLLWNFCLRLRNDTSSDEDKADYALDAWVETQTIQDALDAHVCNLDTALLYMCREYIYNTRMTITQALRRLVPPSDILHGLDSGSTVAPVFNRKQAEEWLYYQDQVIKRIKMSIPQLSEVQGHLLTRRPFQVTWFSTQLAICLSLWTHDHSLLNALELGKSILVPIDILNALWPCPLQQNQCDDLRKNLSDACTAAGLPLPLPREYTLPPILR